MQVTQWILELVDRITSPLHAATDAAEEATRVIDDTEEVVERLGEKQPENWKGWEKECSFSTN